MAQRGDQRLWRVAKLKIQRHKPCRTIKLSLAVEGIGQSDPDRLLIGRKIVEPLPTLAGNMGRRHIQVAREIEGVGLHLIVVHKIVKFQ